VAPRGVTRWLLLTLALWLGAASARPLALADIAADLHIDAAAVSVSGVSSGAYLAQQFHLAHSAHVIGAGLIAGGPHACATGRYAPWSWLDLTGLYTATSRCSDTNPWWFFQGPPALRHSLQASRALAERGDIDPLTGLEGDRVWLFSGGEDETVPASVTRVLEEYYRELLGDSAVRHVHLPRAAHGMIVADGGGACGASRSPYLNDCDVDAAGELLEHLHGRLQDRAPADSPYTSGNSGMLSSGWLYLPQACRAGARCALHLALHGCRQGADAVERAFVEGAGYNEWAQANRIVVLYPQVGAGSGNPRGCWDWWGYSGDDFLTRDGAQIAALARMVDALLGRPLLHGTRR
jgi:poly(3-hydroxybutyrate) depolymerase